MKKPNPDAAVSYPEKSMHSDIMQHNTGYYTMSNFENEAKFPTFIPIHQISKEANHKREMKHITANESFLVSAVDPISQYNRDSVFKAGAQNMFKDLISTPIAMATATMKSTTDGQFVSDLIKAIEIPKSKTDSFLQQTDKTMLPPSNTNTHITRLKDDYDADNPLEKKGKNEKQMLLSKLRDPLIRSKLMSILLSYAPHNKPE